MKRGRAAALVRRRVFAIAMTLAIAGSGMAPFAGNREVARADGGSGTIVHSADGVLLRAEPGFSAQVLETMPEGATVALRTDDVDTVYDPDGVTQWWPVDSGSMQGWVAGFYLKINGYPEAEQAAAPEEAAAPDAAAAPTADAGLGGEQATVPDAETLGDEIASKVEQQFQLSSDIDLASAAATINEPDGVNMREEPGSNSPTVRSLSFQSTVELRVAEMDTVYNEGTRWWPVRADGLVGWVSGAYLSPADAWSAPAADAWTDDSGAEVPSKFDDFFSIGTYVAAITDDGSGLNIRADGAPDAERIGIVPENDVVQVMDGPSWDPIGNPWYMITDGNVTGFVNGWYLSRADQPGAALDGAVVPSKITPPGVASGAFEYPLLSWTFTQGFGCSPYYFEPWDSTVGCNFHNGVDLAAPMYTPLEAADGGTVDYAGWCDCGLGYYVKIDHGNGFQTLYGHMADQPWVSAGQAVSKGDIIGEVGSTGMSTGPHVHFIVQESGTAVDPLAFLPT